MRTPAEWEIMEGELHDMRATRAVIEYRARKLKAGLMSPESFADWVLQRIATDREYQLTRFKNVTRRYQEQKDANANQS